MIAAEYKTNLAVVRIHDDLCGEKIERSISRISSVVSASYKRRSMERADQIPEAVTTDKGSKDNLA